MSACSGNIYRVSHINFLFLMNWLKNGNTYWDTLYILNPLMLIFSLTTLETFIHQRWMGMYGTDRAEIRTNLNNFLSQHHASVPQFIRNKLIKLIVDIAR